MLWGCTVLTCDVTQFVSNIAWRHACSLPLPPPLPHPIHPEASRARSDSKDNYITGATFLGHFQFFLQSILKIRIHISLPHISMVPLLTMGLYPTPSTPPPPTIPSCQACLQLLSLCSINMIFLPNWHMFPSEKISGGNWVHATCSGAYDSSLFENRCI